MRFEKHDLDILLPLCLTQLSKKGNVTINRLDYLLDKKTIALKTEFLYAGLPVRFEGLFRIEAKNGALTIEIQKNNIDSLLMKGDALPFLKTVIRNNEHLMMKGNTVYFYHEKMPIHKVNIDEDGIELSFTSIEK